MREHERRAYQLDIAEGIYESDGKYYNGELIEERKVPRLRRLNLSYNERANEEINEIINFKGDSLLDIRATGAYKMSISEEKNAASEDDETKENAEILIDDIEVNVAEEAPRRTFIRDRPVAGYSDPSKFDLSRKNEEILP